MSRPLVPIRALLGAALKSREAFEAISASEVLADLPDTPGDLWRELEKHYAAAGAEAKAAHPELVQAALEARYTDVKRRRRAGEFVGGILAEDVSVGAVSDYLRSYRVERAGEALAAGLLARRGDPGDLLQAYMDAQGTPGGAAPVDDVSYLGAIQARVPREGRIRVRIKAINERFRGGVLPGHSIIIVARPNAGKSALAISLGVGFARDGRKVLYVGNEDHIWDLMSRAVSNITGLTVDEVERDPAGAVERARSAGVERLLFRQLAPGTLAELEKAVKEVRPEILIVDQLRNITTRSDSYTQKLEAVAQGIRNLGLKYQVVTISVTQAGDSAEGKPVLDMGDIDFSNTGIPAACDVLLMMGVTETLKAAGMRKISLAKNKIGGVEDSFDVKLDPTRSKVTST